MLLLSIIYHKMAFGFLWTHPKMYLWGSKEISGVFLVQNFDNSLMHCCWRLHQQYPHVGIGPSLRSEVTHRPWITLPCSGVLWCRGLTVFDQSTMWSLSLSPPVMLLPSPLPHIPTTGPVMSGRENRTELNRNYVSCPSVLVRWGLFQINDHSLWREWIEWWMPKQPGNTNKAQKERQKGLKNVFSCAFLFASCLFWQLRRRASLAVCLSSPLCFVPNTGGSLVFGSPHLAVNRQLGLSITAMFDLTLVISKI